MIEFQIETTKSLRRICLIDFIAEPCRVLIVRYDARTNARLQNIKWNMHMCVCVTLDLALDAEITCIRTNVYVCKTMGGV